MDSRHPSAGPVSVGVLDAPWIAPALAAALVVIIGLPLAAFLNVWIDEAYTLHTTGAGVAGALEQATSFELQPPVYFVLEAAWRLADETSIGFARLPSIVFAAAAAALVVVAARKIAPALPPVAVALATAINPIVIWAAVEMRVYSLVLLISALICLTFIDGFLAPDGPVAARVGYAVTGIIGLYTQYYIAFVLAACAITLLVVDRRALRAFVVANVAIALAFLPFVPIALAQVRAADGADVRHVSLFMALHEIFNANFIYILPHDIDWTRAIKILGFVVAAVFAALLGVVGRPRLTESGRALVFAWIVASLIFAGVSAVAGEAFDVRRHAIALAPAAILSSYAILCGLRARRRELWLAGALVFAAFTAGDYWAMYAPPLAKSGDWKGVAARLTSDGARPVIVFPANLVLALRLYLPSQSVVVPLPGPMSFTAHYLAAMKLRSEAQVAETFDRAGVRSGPFWLVTDNSCDPGPLFYDFACGYLRSFLRGRYVVKARYRFRGSFATLYESSALGGRRARLTESPAGAFIARTGAAAP